jgi:LacI family transcriptional regulator
MNYRRVTIVEIAKEAGVSAQTVSRVVNGHVSVSEETREKVQAIIDRRGYHPSRLARSLLRGHSNTIGVVSFGLGLYGPSQTLAGIVRDADRQGYTILPVVLNEPETKYSERIIGQLIEFHVDGIIWAVPQIGHNHEWVEAVVSRLEVPIVFITMEAHPNLTIVRMDNRAGGRLAAEHLIARGRRTLGLITGHPDWWETSERMRGWSEALQAHGLPIREELILAGDWSAAAGERCMRDLLEAHPDVDGVFVGNDSMAVGALKAARELGRQVPQDLGLVGFDDIPEAAYVHPALTTIHQDLHLLGSKAVAALNSLIGGAQSQSASILIQPKLVVRNST